MQPPPKIGNCKIFDNFCLAKKQAIRQQTIDIQNPALNTIAHLMVNIPFENIPKTITFFQQAMQHGEIRGKVLQRFLPWSTHTPFQRLQAYLLTAKIQSLAVFIVEMKKHQCFVSDSRKVISSIKYCLYTTFMRKFSKLRMQVEVSSNRYHLL